MSENISREHLTLASYYIKLNHRPTSPSFGEITTMNVVLVYRTTTNFQCRALDKAKKPIEGNETLLLKNGKQNVRRKMTCISNYMLKRFF